MSAIEEGCHSVSMLEFQLTKEREGWNMAWVAFFFLEARIELLQQLHQGIQRNGIKRIHTHLSIRLNPDLVACMLCQNWKCRNVN